MLDEREQLPVIAQPWPEFITSWKRRWAQGEHVALIGPTGVGKTTAAVQLLEPRKWVVALDVKGEDSTLSVLEQRGYERISQWPPPQRYMERLANREPVRLIVGRPVESEGDEVKLRALLEKTIAGVFQMRGWTMYVDELQLAADRRMMNLTKPIERNLIASRDRRVTMMSSYQAPVNVPRRASDQATYLFVWPTRDDDVVKRVAEMMGRSKLEVRATLRAMPNKFCVVMVSRDFEQPMIATLAPRIN